jgi:hydrogenase expression/formation protein HypC
MCIGFPGQVVDLDAGSAFVETDGRRRRANTLYLPDVAVGDWVIVAAGTIVERIDPDRANEINTLLHAAIDRDMADDGTPQLMEGAFDVHTP